MAWPTPQDYNEAVQNPHLNFSDAELRMGDLEVTPMGLPRVTSGAFASVYRMHTTKRDVAVRCFLHNVEDQHRRYEAISRFVSGDSLDCTVDFEYLTEGVRVIGGWYPVLKMEWAAGRSLDEYVKVGLGKADALRDLAERFKAMLAEMRRDGIAHGDLQHGNVLVASDGSIRLVDYDGMFVPSLAGLPCPELGHRNYQHPGRTQDHFGPYLDNFAAWSIYISLVALSVDSTLLDKVKGGDESLLFRQYDYKNPLKSRTFATLEDHECEELRELARKFRGMLAVPPDKVPYLDDEVEVPDSLPVLQLKRRGGTAGGGLPDWMVEGGDDEDEEDEVDFRDALDRAAAPISVGIDEPLAWPSLNQYIAAITTPAACFIDEELKLSRPVRDVGGKVKPANSGQNAVFRLQRAARSFAVKVFLTPDPDREKRYKEFAKFLRSEDVYFSDLHSYIPRVEFIEDGIRVGDRLYPIVKMEWIEGRSLDTLSLDPKFMNEAVLDSAKVQFRRLIQAMSKAGMVHGELEPANLILSPEGLRLIDFDAVSVDFATPRAVSAGHYRHPQESYRVDAHSDLFPAWLIDTALVVLREQPDLRFAVPSNKFLIGRSDLENPDESDVMNSMKESKNTVVHQRWELLKALLSTNPSNMPKLRLDAGLDRSFAKYFQLNFVDVGNGMVSPDLEPVKPPSLVPSVQLKTREQIVSEQMAALQVIGGMGILGLTVWSFFNIGLQFSVLLLLMFLIWNKLFPERRD